MILCLLFSYFMDIIILKSGGVFMKFGDRLKNARTEMNSTQEQVANDFFITRQTISSWENEMLLS